jgi:ferredoxin
MLKEIRVISWVAICACACGLFQGLRSSFSSCKSRNRQLKMEMAPYKQPHRSNVPGNLFVDQSCIDCDVCRWMCPTVFSAYAGRTIVTNQPQNVDEKAQAYAAMISCPVGAIRTRNADPLVKQILQSFPIPIDEEKIPGVMHCGFHSALSYGATSYFIHQPNQGNVLIDSPRYHTKLADRFEALGGIKYMILTHIDDVADHVKWKQRFPEMQRIIHR